MSMLKEKNVRLSFTKRLQKAHEMWKEYVKPILNKSNNILEFWSAGYYSSSETPSRPINLTDRGISTLAPFLVMSSPKVYIKTRYPELRPYAYTIELALNYHAQSTNFHSRALRPAVINALIGMGIIKTGVMHAYDVEILGATHELGEVYSDVVDFSNYIGDPSARHRDGFELEGDTYQLPTDYAKEFFGSKFADEIKPTYRLWGDESPEHVVKKNMNNQDYRLKEYTEFADFYIPDENIVVTIDPNNPNPKILHTVEWKGIGRGPYDILSFKDVPGTPVPLPPVWGWLDLEDAMNTIIKKMRVQAEDEKSVLAYMASSEDDAKRIANAKDRSTCRVDGIEGVKIFDFPGINQDYYPWISYVEQQYSKQGPNLEVIGGRGQAAETLGQEQMIQANASRTVDDMMSRVHDFANKVFQKRASLLWDDPVIQIPVQKIISKSIQVPALFSKADHQGKFWQYSFEIVPYSMQRLGPDIEYRRLMTYLSQVALPMAQIAAQQGQQIDIHEVNKALAHYMGIDEIDAFWHTAMPQNQMELNPYNPQNRETKASKPVGEDPRSGIQSPHSNEMNSIQSSMKNENQV